MYITKGVYPYEYMDSFNKFEEKELPNKDKFYSSLNDENISDEKYKYANDIWQEFDIKNMGEYHDFYLMSDVLLLADVFEKFRKTCYNIYSLDPAWYLTAPGLAWDAMLKYTGVAIKLFTEDQSEIYQMVKENIRGGISMISNRYAKANNKYMSNYDHNIEYSFIQYDDANNLYGLAMSLLLPYDNYELFKENLDKYTEDFILNIDDDSKIGYIFDVDLEYSKELHDYHSDYSLCPEKKIVKDDQLSQYQLKLKKKLNIKKDRVPKLICDLTDKKGYVTHLKSLKQDLKMGLKLIKVNRVTTFSQSNWLAKYINKNTNERKNAKNDFEKDFFKLMNNSVFGKTMENVENRIDMELVINNEKRLKKILNDPLKYKRSTIYDEQFVAVHKNKLEVVLDKPIIVGFCILDLSKHHMYDFYYNVLKKNYGDKIKLLFTDTDSLCYHVKTEDYYEDLKTMKLQQYYDFSEYNEKHFLYNTENKKVIGKFKSETGCRPITEFVGLRSKMYSVKIENELKFEKAYEKAIGDKLKELSEKELKKLKDEKRTGKGIKKCVLNKQINHDNNFKPCLENETKESHSMKLIRSTAHNLYSVDVTKISLSCFDNKKFILENGCDCLAYGHYLIR